MFIGLNFNSFINIANSLFHTPFLHKQVSSILVVNMIVWAQAYRMIVAFDGFIKLSEFYLSESPVVVEKIVRSPCF